MKKTVKKSKVGGNEADPLQRGVRGTRGRKKHDDAAEAGPSATEDAIQSEEDVVSLCEMSVGSQSFGIDTRRIGEVLGDRELQRVPMAPAFIGGVVPYRGEVLTTVSTRALLGLTEKAETHCVLVLEDEDTTQRFGLMVDAVGGVVTVNRRMFEANPSTLDARGKWLFGGAYKTEGGLTVLLDPRRLQPAKLAEVEIFRQNGGAA